MPREEGGVRCAVVLCDQVQAQVDPRTDTGAGGEVAVVHVEPVRLHAHPGKLLSKLLGAASVGGGGTAVQQPRAGQREHSGADRDQPRPARVGLTQCAAYTIGQWRLYRQPARDDDGIGGLERGQAPRDEDGVSGEVGTWPGVSVHTSNS
ncbi:hypothetical protein GCM10027610_023940 [Dactylosporangium cerinum]